METKALTRSEVALSQKEREAYQKYLEAGKPSLAASTAGNFFQLYLQGHSTEEIAKLNPGFGLGIIVKAKVDNDWDTQRDQYLIDLMSNIRQVAQKTQLEAVRFVADGLAVYQKMVGQKFERYLQTGDSLELGDFKDMSFRQYKELLELLLKLTGQEGNKKVSGEVVHRHVDEANQPLPTLSRIDKPMSASEAEAFLRRLDVGPKAKK